MINISKLLDYIMESVYLNLKTFLISGLIGVSMFYVFGSGLKYILLVFLFISISCFLVKLKMSEFNKSLSMCFGLLLGFLINYWFIFIVMFYCGQYFYTISHKHEQ